MGQKWDGLSGGISLGFHSLMRRKQVDNDSVHVRKHQLAKELSALQLIAIGNYVLPSPFSVDFVHGDDDCIVGFLLFLGILSFLVSCFLFLCRWSIFMCVI